jgi:hypothetical protein
MRVSALVEVRYLDGRPPSLCARIESADTTLDLPITLEQAALLLREASATELEEEMGPPAVPIPAKKVQSSGSFRMVTDEDDDEDDDL